MLIKVKVITEAGKYEIVKKTSDSYVIFVKEKAEGGMANSAVKQILVSHFRVHEGKIRLIKGGKQPNKIFMVR